MNPLLKLAYVLNIAEQCDLHYTVSLHEIYGSLVLHIRKEGVTTELFEKLYLQNGYIWDEKKAEESLDKAVSEIQEMIISSIDLRLQKIASDIAYSRGVDENLKSALQSLTRI